MRATEFIEPEEQLKLLTKIANDTRAKLERDTQAQQQLGSAGDFPLDFFKKILDVAWDEITQWLVQSGAAGTNNAGSSPIAPSSSVSPKTVAPQPIGKKPAVARPNKLKTKPKATPKKNKGVKSKKPPKPKRVEPPPPPKPVPQPVKRVTPINPNPGQPLARIKPYGTLGLMK